MQDERIAKLPTWVRDLIKRLEYANEPMLAECVKLRRQNAELTERARRASDSNEALMELLRCAGRGGSDWAAAVVSTLEGYEIFQPTEGVTGPVGPVGGIGPDAPIPSRNPRKLWCD